MPTACLDSADLGSEDTFAAGTTDETKVGGGRGEGGEREGLVRPEVANVLLTTYYYSVCADKMGVCI